MLRGVSFGDGAIFVLCSAHKETMAHLFLHCSKVWCLWVDVISRDGQVWMVPESVHACLAEWGFLHLRTSRVLWELILYAICWVVLMAQNKLIFNNKSFDAEAVWSLICFCYLQG